MELYFKNNFEIVLYYFTPLKCKEEQRDMGVAVSSTTCTPDVGRELGRNMKCSNNRKKRMFLKCEYIDEVAQGR
jgi:hypothetical protein